MPARGPGSAAGRAWREGAPHVADTVLSNVGPGRPLDSATRAFFEARFGRDLSDVRVHTDTQAAESARGLRARAYTAGSRVVFGAGQYAPGTGEGSRLLAHELAHVTGLSTNVIARKEAPAAGIDHAKAKKRNLELARTLSWDARLVELKPEWNLLWDAADFDGFADAVADFQKAQKMKTVDGVLGPATWNRIRPMGEIATELECDEFLCYGAAKERVESAYRMHTGTTVKASLPEGATANLYEKIWASIPAAMFAEIPAEYRGKGGAGAVVYAGIADEVTEADIWTGDLEPGAVLQTWRQRSDYDLLARGYKEVTKKGKTVRVALKSEDLESIGHSFIFVSYVRDELGTITGMNILDQFGRHTVTPARYDVWLAANLK